MIILKSPFLKLHIFIRICKSTGMLFFLFQKFSDFIYSWVIGLNKPDYREFSHVTYYHESAWINIRAMLIYLRISFSSYLFCYSTDLWFMPSKIFYFIPASWCIMCSWCNCLFLLQICKNGFLYYAPVMLQNFLPDAFMYILSVSAKYRNVCSLE